MSKVSIVKCHEYESALCFKAVEEAMTLAGKPEIEGKRVLVKPNILYAVSPDRAATTHPAVLEAVIKVLKKEGAKEIVVGDSPGFGSGQRAGRKSGLLDVVEREGVVWDNFSETVSVHVPNARKVTRFDIVKSAVEADLVITLPKLKTHEMMYYTGAMKNLYGTLIGLTKSQYHFKFPEKEEFASLIVDLNSALKGSYAIMDAVWGMEGPGPGSGTPRKVGVILASSNTLALDWVASTIIGYHPESLPLLREAMERGEWLSSEDEIKSVGESPESVAIPDYKRVKILKRFVNVKLPKPIATILKNIYIPRPFFSKKACTACGGCIHICPASVLKFQESNKKKWVAIDYSRCIRCYCCHEVCPSHAIKVKRRV